MKISIDCLGVSHRWCGSDRIELELPPAATLAMALDELARRHADFAARRGQVAVAIGDQIASDDAVLHDNDKLALIPPVSGG